MDNYLLFCSRNQSKQLEPFLIMEVMYKKLRAAVEKTAGRKMCAPTDFNYLSEDICEKTRITINPMTLKRFWGYFSNQETRNPRRFTLDVLCLYVGYQDWDAFIHDSTANVEIESDFIKNKCLYVSVLEPQALLRLTWNPNRCVTIRYDGDRKFTVQAEERAVLVECLPSQQE